VCRLSTANSRFAFSDTNSGLYYSQVKTIGELSDNRAEVVHNRDKIDEF
jgi:hypothetical protein